MTSQLHNYGKIHFCLVDPVYDIFNLFFVLCWSIADFGEEMAIHNSIIAWEIPWTEEPGGIQSMGSQTVGHN